MTRAEVADAAGVDQAFVERLIELGIIAGDEFNEGHVRRVQITRSLERSGLPLEGVARALSDGFLSLEFVDQKAYDRFTALTDETFEGASARTGVPVDLLLVIREAMGFAPGAAADRMRPDELAVVPFLEFMVSNRFRHSAIERAVRVMGDSLRRIADAEADWYNSEVLRPLFEAGKTMHEIGELTAEVTGDLDEISERAMLAIFRGHQSHAWMRNIFEAFETGLRAGGFHQAVDHPPAISFLDLTGYTRLTDERGDEAAAQLAERLSRLVQRTSLQLGGRPVKWLGDGVMFWFREPAAAVLASLEMVAAATTEGLPPAHVGIHCGPVLFQEGDYFGRTVNLASRIADYARPGEVLVTKEVLDATTTPGMTFREIGPVELKGMSEPVVLFTATRG
jgi:adenylate cyclase